METLQTENEVLEALKSNKEFAFTLRSLRLDPIPSSPLVRRSLIQNTTIRSLNITFEERQDWKFAADIIKNKKFRKLHLGVAIKNRTDPDFKCLCESLKENISIENLHIFNVLQSEEDVEQFCDGLDSNTSVLKLTLCSIDENAFHYLARRFMDNTTVKHLRVWNRDIDPKDIATIIKYNGSLTSISFTLANLDSTGESLISALRLNSTLKKISLAGSRSGIVSITQGLKRNFSLRKITFRDFDIEDENLVRELIEQMKNKIEHLRIFYSNIGRNLDLLRELFSVTSFKTLILLSCAIATDQIRVIAESLKTNQNLTHLDLSSNNITAQELPYLVEGLKANKTLIRLNLTESEMNSDAAEYLAEILKANTPLQDLNLDNNYFDSDALKTIGEALKMNRTLLRLHIEHEILGNPLPAFIEPLKVNRSLEYLHLMFDPADAISALNFCEVMKHNTNLTTVILREIRNQTYFAIEPAPQLIQGFKNIFQHNRALTKFKIQSCLGRHIQQRFNEFTDENKRLQIEFKNGMKVLMLNIVRSSYARQLLPIEIWRIILSQLDYPGIKSLRSMAESICK